MRKYGILPTLAALSLAGCAHIKVVEIKPDAPHPPKANGVFYALPKTVLRVSLTAEKTERTPAPFTEYAAIFAPGADPVCEDAACKQPGRVTYAVKNGATISSYGTPDPSRVYMLQFNGGGAVDQSLNLAWNDAGLLSSASASVTNRTTDIVVSALKFAAGVGSRLAFAGGAAAPAAITRDDKCPAPANTDPPFVKELRSDRNLLGNYCSIPPPVRGKLRYDADLLKGAIAAYNMQIADLVRQRGIILGGAQVYDPVGQVNKLEAMITANLAPLFIGSKSIVAWNATIDVEPTLSGGKPRPAYPLLRVSDAQGVCLADGVKLAPISDQPPAKFTASDPDCQKGTPVVLSVSLFPDENQQTFGAIQAGTKAPDGKSSFRYRIPAQVLAEVTEDRPQHPKTYGAAVLSVAQYGVVASLPAGHRSKTLSYDLGIVEATGGLKSFKLGATGGLDSGTIDALTGISNDTLDARNKARAAAQDKRQKDADAQSQINLLKNQADILEQQDRICTIQTKYNLPCTVKP